MTTNNNLDALSQDAELPFSHPVRRSDHTPEGFEPSPLVAGCPDCLELAAENLDEDNEHWANCLHCQQEISARNDVEWRRVVRAPCPHCGKLGW